MLLKITAFDSFEWSLTTLATSHKTVWCLEIFQDIVLNKSVIQLEESKLCIHVEKNKQKIATCFRILWGTLHFMFYQPTSKNQCLSLLHFFPNICLIYFILFIYSIHINIQGQWLWLQSNNVNSALVKSFPMQNPEPIQKVKALIVLFQRSIRKKKKKKSLETFSTGIVYS